MLLILLLAFLLAVPCIGGNRVLVELTKNNLSLGNRELFLLSTVLLNENGQETTVDGSCEITYVFHITGPAGVQLEGTTSGLIKIPTGLSGTATAISLKANLLNPDLIFAGKAFINLQLLKLRGASFQNNKKFLNLDIGLSNSYVFETPNRNLFDLFPIRRIYTTESTTIAGFNIDLSDVELNYIRRGILDTLRLVYCKTYQEESAPPAYLIKINESVLTTHIFQYLDHKCVNYKSKFGNRKCVDYDYWYNLYNTDYVFQSSQIKSLTKSNLGVYFSIPNVRWIDIPLDSSLFLVSEFPAEVLSVGIDKTSFFAGELVCVGITYTQPIFISPDMRCIINGVSSEPLNANTTSTVVQYGYMTSKFNHKYELTVSNINGTNAKTIYNRGVKNSAALWTIHIEMKVLNEESFANCYTRPPSEDFFIKGDTIPLFVELYYNSDKNYDLSEWIRRDDNISSVAFSYDNGATFLPLNLTEKPNLLQANINADEFAVTKDGKTVEGTYFFQLYNKAEKTAADYVLIEEKTIPILIKEMLVADIEISIQKINQNDTVYGDGSELLFPRYYSGLALRANAKCKSSNPLSPYRTSYNDVLWSVINKDDKQAPPIAEISQSGEITILGRYGRFEVIAVSKNGSNDESLWVTKKITLAIMCDDTGEDPVDGRDSLLANLRIHYEYLEFSPTKMDYRVFTNKKSLAIFFTAFNENSEISVNNEVTSQDSIVISLGKNETTTVVISVKGELSLKESSYTLVFISKPISALEILFPTASPIKYKEPLSTSTLQGGSNFGHFKWVNESIIPETNSGSVYEAEVVFFSEENYYFDVLLPYIRTVSVKIEKGTLKLSLKDMTFVYDGTNITVPSEAILVDGNYDGYFSFSFFINHNRDCTSMKDGADVLCSAPRLPGVYYVEAISTCLEYFETKSNLAKITIFSSDGSSNVRLNGKNWPKTKTLEGKLRVFIDNTSSEEVFISSDVNAKGFITFIFTGMKLVPDGFYPIYYCGKNTGFTVSVKDNSVSPTVLDFYSVEIEQMELGEDVKIKAYSENYTEVASGSTITLVVETPAKMNWILFDKVTFRNANCRDNICTFIVNSRTVFFFEGYIVESESNFNYNGTEISPLLLSINLESHHLVKINDKSQKTNNTFSLGMASSEGNMPTTPGSYFLCLKGYLTYETVGFEILPPLKVNEILMDSEDREYVSVESGSLQVPTWATILYIFTPENYESSGISLLQIDSLNKGLINNIAYSVEVLSFDNLHNSTPPKLPTELGLYVLVYVSSSNIAAHYLAVDSVKRSFDFNASLFNTEIEVFKSTLTSNHFLGGKRSYGQLIFVSVKNFRSVDAELLLTPITAVKIKNNEYSLTSDNEIKSIVLWTENVTVEAKNAIGVIVEKQIFGPEGISNFNINPLSLDSVENVMLDNYSYQILSSQNYDTAKFELKISRDISLLHYQLCAVFCSDWKVATHYNDKYVLDLVFNTTDIEYTLYILLEGLHENRAFSYAMYRVSESYCPERLASSGEYYTAEYKHKGMECLRCPGGYISSENNMECVLGGGLIAAIVISSILVVILAITIPIVAKKRCYNCC